MPAPGSPLARDARRAWTALIVAGALSLVVTLALPLLTDDGVVRERFAAFQVGTLLTVFILYFGTYILLTWRVFRGLEGEELRRVLRASLPRDRRARLSQALSGGGAASWSVSAALTALAFAVAVAFLPDLRQEPVVLALTGLAVALSWLQLPVTFAVQYLRDDLDGRGLEFPGESAFRASDYFYLAVQITTTFSSSDVAVRSSALRRRVTAHSLIAFLFNSVIIALVVSALLIAAPTS